MTDRELMQQALEALESSRVFVTTREKIKHPEGLEWYDERITALRDRLAQPQMQPCAGRNCNSTNPNLHSAECFEDYEKSTGMAQPVAPKCGAIIEVFGKDWRLEYMSLPVGKHKLYTQQYTYIAPPQPEQEPVAHTLNCVCGAVWDVRSDGVEEMVHAPTPPQRTWVGLTDEEMQDLWDRYAHMEMMRAIEAKLKEKNT